MPPVSIILPTYNRARFLQTAFSSIQSQTFTSWELIVVDDGSTDKSENIVNAFSRRFPGRVVYLRQSNEGPAAARNAGIRLARGGLIAFYDSDDTWTEVHLEHCVRALDANPDVHWVYGSFCRSRLTSGEIIERDVFRPVGVPAPFLSLRASRHGALQVIDDDRVLECAITHGIGVGLKVSVARRSVFDAVPIPEFRVGEDQALISRALAKGMQFGYLDEIHGTAYVHDSNISTVSGTLVLDKSIQILGELVRALESLRDLPLTRVERKALNRRVASERFWNMGYSCVKAGRMRQGLSYMAGGLHLDPANLRFWKTYILANIRYRLG